MNIYREKGCRWSQVQTRRQTGTKTEARRQRNGGGTQRLVNMEVGRVLFVQTDRQRERERETETERQRETQRQRQRETETETDRDGERQRQRETGRERQRDKERQRETERDLQEDNPFGRVSAQY